MSFALGMLAATVAPLMMVLGFIIWDNHWTGSAFSLNLFKCNLAALGFAAVSYYNIPPNGLQGDVFTTQKVGALMLSSTLGILIGDWAWLEGMRLLGSRKVVVMDSLKPFLAAILGKWLLEERLDFMAYVGLVLTVLGVALVGVEQEVETPETAIELIVDDNGDVALESDTLISPTLPTAAIHSDTYSYARQRRNRKNSRFDLMYAWIVGALNVVLHTVGVLITKKFGEGMTTFQINFIRFGFAGACMLVLAVSLRTGMVELDVDTYGPRWNALPKLPFSVWLRISLGVSFVSFLMPALTNYAMFQISLAMLLTLESIGPIYSLPLTVVLEGHYPSIHATLGALLAVAGIAMLAFKGTPEKDDNQ